MSNLLCKPIYESYGTGNLTLTTTPQVLDLDIEAFNNSDEFSNTNGVITYSGATRDFKVFYSVTGNAGANTRSTARHSLFINGTEEVRTRRYSYHRTLVDGEDSASFSGIFTLVSGQTISVRSREEAAGDNVLMQLEQCNILLEAI